jgi:hypothetical protein
MLALEKSTSRRLVIVAVISRPRTFRVKLSPMPMPISSAASAEKLI